MLYINRVRVELADHVIVNVHIFVRVGPVLSNHLSGSVSFAKLLQIFGVTLIILQRPGVSCLLRENTKTAVLFNFQHNHFL